MRKGYDFVRLLGDNPKVINYTIYLDEKSVGVLRLLMEDNDVVFRIMVLDKEGAFILQETMYHEESIQDAFNHVKEISPKKFLERLPKEELNPKPLYFKVHINTVMPFQYLLSEDNNIHSVNSLFPLSFPTSDEAKDYMALTSVKSAINDILFKGGLAMLSYEVIPVYEK